MGSITSICGGGGGGGGRKRRGGEDGSIKQMRLYLGHILRSEGAGPLGHAISKTGSNIIITIPTPIWVADQDWGNFYSKYVHDYVCEMCFLKSKKQNNMRMGSDSPLVENS